MSPHWKVLYCMLALLGLQELGFSCPSRRARMTHRKQALDNLGDDAADEEGHEQRQEQRCAADVPYTLVRTSEMSARVAER